MFEFRNPGQLIDDDLTLVLVNKYPGDCDKGLVPAYGFEMRNTGTDEQVGTIDLRIGNLYDLVMYSGHIGFTVLKEYRGHRYAARACKLLFPLARSHGIEMLWITCNPDNIASRRTCERAGGEYVETIDLPKDTNAYKKGERQKRRYKFEL